MKSFLIRFLLRQKLLLGILWLMLRGSSVDGQDITRPEGITCYMRMPRHPMLHNRDLAISEAFGSNTINLSKTSISVGLNWHKFTVGGVFETENQTKSIDAGPYARYFPFSFVNDTSHFHLYKNKTTVFAEANYRFNFSTNTDFKPISLSVGLIYSHRRLWGIELYESYSLSLNELKNYQFWTGLRFHIYLT